MKATRLAHLLAALLLVAVPAAHAHDEATLDATAAPHGGQLRMAGSYHLELVLDPKATAGEPAPVRVYVTDHAGARAAVAGATGSATLLAGGTKTTVELKPDNDNAMNGSGSYAVKEDIKVIVAITLQGQAPLQARFTPGVVAVAGKTGYK